MHTKMVTLAFSPSNFTLHRQNKSTTLVINQEKHIDANSQSISSTI